MAEDRTEKIDINTLYRAVGRIEGELVGMKGYMQSIDEKMDGLHCLKEKEIENIGAVAVSNSERIGKVELKVSNAKVAAKAGWSVGKYILVFIAEAIGLSVVLGGLAVGVAKYLRAAP